MRQGVPWWMVLVVMAACLAPIFLMAKEVDGDEFAKSGLGIATVGAIVGIWTAWINFGAKRKQG